LNALGFNRPAQRGAVLIMVLWTTVVLTVLVTVLASNIRLSANTALYHQQGAQGFASVMDAMNKAEMELMMERMPTPAGVTSSSQDITEVRFAAYRFNGQPLRLNYPADENMVVRIYSHAGKININRIRPERLQRLIEARLGPNFNPVQVQELLAAWSDWVDLNDVPTPGGGAESAYYLSLDPPYTARNSPDFDSVEEVRLIRGFDELFKDVNLEAAFTVYGNASVVNPNFATREALLLLPGLDEELVEKIIALREQQDITHIREIGDIVPLEQLVELSPWLNIDYDSSVFSVYAYPRQHSDSNTDNNTEIDPVIQATMQIMEVRGFDTRARIHKVHPYAQLPDTAPARTQ
jgi:general secretion pathway protein K